MKIKKKKLTQGLKKNSYLEIYFFSVTYLSSNVNLSGLIKDHTFLRCDNRVFYSRRHLNY